MKTILVLLASIALFGSGCASIIKGTSQSVTVTSEPSNAKVFFDGQNLGNTPLTVKLKKNKYDTISVQKSGYESQTRPIDKSFDAVALLNFFWDLSTTDFITGAIYEYEPNTYHFSLEKGGSSENKK